MALADSVPGVSGGTIAFIMGFYDHFIASINNVVFGKKEEKTEGLKYFLKLGVGIVPASSRPVSYTHLIHSHADLHCFA